MFAFENNVNYTSKLNLKVKVTLYYWSIDPFIVDIAVNISGKILLTCQEVK